MTNVTKKEPSPSHSERSRPVTRELIKLIELRSDMGERKHGVKLHTHNDRDATMDALQESIDLNQYLMQALMETKELWHARLERSVRAENKLFRAAKNAGMTPGDCHKLALDLGTPDDKDHP